MFDIGWQEMFIAALLAIVVIGPKDLPRALKAVAKVVRKARGMAKDFQDSFDEVVKEAELDDIKKQVTDGGKLDIGKQLQDTVDPKGDFADTLNKDMLNIQQDLNKAGREEGKANAMNTDAKPEPVADMPMQPNPLAESEPAPAAAPAASAPEKKSSEA